MHRSEKCMSGFMGARIEIPEGRIQAFCRKWKVSELALFGSVLREDFGPESDVDVLVNFAPGGKITFDNRIEIMDELTEIFHRRVDLVEKNAIRNPFRRDSILKSKYIIYAA